VPRGQRISDDSAQFLVQYRLGRFQLRIEQSQLDFPERSKDFHTKYHLRDDPIGCVIYQQENASPGLAIHPEHYGSWWPELQQRLLISNHLRLECLKHGELKSLFLTNSLDLLLFVNSVIFKKDPEVAVAINRLVGCMDTLDKIEEQQKAARIVGRKYEN
jgi:hypothetical protein